MKKWIPVSEKLPTKGDYYIVNVESMRESDEEYVVVKHTKDWESLKEYGFEVTAWQPIPSYMTVKTKKRRNGSRKRNQEVFYE